MDSTTNTKPTRVFRCGTITATVWVTPQVRGGKVMEIPSIKIDRSYEADRQRRYSASFFPEDLLKVALVATEAFKSLKLRSVEPDGSQPREKRTDGGEGNG